MEVAGVQANLAAANTKNLQAWVTARARARARETPPASAAAEWQRLGNLAARIPGAVVRDPVN
jgi:hypothetical protein